MSRAQSPIEELDTVLVKVVQDFQQHLYRTIDEEINEYKDAANIAESNMEAIKAMIEELMQLQNVFEVYAQYTQDRINVLVDVQANTPVLHEKNAKNLMEPRGLAIDSIPTKGIENTSASPSEHMREVLKRADALYNKDLSQANSHNNTMSVIETR